MATGVGQSPVIAIKAGYAAPDTRRVFSARHAGWYRFKISASAVRNGGEPVRLKIGYGSFRRGTIPAGNGPNHSNKDLPVLLIGGRFTHGQHLAFDRSTVPLSNLLVSVLNQFGLAEKSFATSTGPLQGLEF